MKRQTLARRCWLLALEIAAPVAALAAWALASASSTDPFFPPLTDILVRFRELWFFSHFTSDVVPSLVNLVLGFVIGSAAGIAAGIVFSMIRWTQGALMPLVHLYRAIPPVAVIPIFIAVLGFGDEVRVFVITLAAVFPALIATLDGVLGVEPMLEDVGRAFGFTSTDRIWRVMLPSAAPQIFSGLEVSMQYSLVVMIASEMLGSPHGIGAMTILAQQSFMAPDMWAGVLLLGLIGYLSNFLLRRIRHAVLGWYDAVRAQEKS